jgi:hypothetical protein
MAGWAVSCLIIYLFCQLCLTVKKAKLQFDITLNNEVAVLENFIQNFGMACIYFSKISAIPKSN